MTQHATYLPGTASHRPIRLVRDPHVCRLTRPASRSVMTRTPAPPSGSPSRTATAKPAAGGAAA